MRFPERLLAILFVLVVSRDASAFVESQGDVEFRYDHEVGACSSYNTHWDQVPIPVYINNSSSFGVQLLKKPLGGGYWSVPEVERELNIALADFNDSVGIPIRLYYSGLTTFQTIAGGIVVLMDPLISAA